VFTARCKYIGDGVCLLRCINITGRRVFITAPCKYIGDGVCLLCGPSVIKVNFYL
jgi:hypothetical protein